MKELERILKALANKRRLAILRFLKEDKEVTVGEIAVAIHLSFKATSKHLGILTNVDILERDQRSIFIFYRLTKKPPIFFKSILSLL